MSNIYPSLGVDQLRFGMLKEDIDRCIGPATMTRKTPRGELSEFRGASFPRLSLADNRLVELSFLPIAGPLELDGCDLFTGDEIAALKMVESKYGPLSVHVGFVVSLKAGLAFTGFHDRDQAQKAITVFPVGRWDRFLPDMQAVSFL